MKKIRFEKCALTCALVFAVMFGPAKAQTTLTIQPGPEDGFDSPIGIYPFSNYANMNFSAMKELLAKALTINGSCSIARSLIRFDLSAVPANATILSANLSLYSVTDVNPRHIGANASYIRRVTSDWNNTTVTWNTEPTTTFVDQVILPQSISPTQDYTLDVTNMVRVMTASPQLNYGFELGLLDESCDRILNFGSSKNLNPAKRPRLIVQFAIFTGMDELRNTESISMYPNPSTGIFTITNTEPKEIRIFNVLGKLVFESTPLEGCHWIDLSKQPEGIYFVQQKRGNSVKVEKLVKEN